MTLNVPDSVIGRLLQEVSWEGNPKHYRDGGIGRENVLTAEVFQALDFLPRDAFLGSVIRAARGAPEARSQVAGEIEQARMLFLAEYWRPLATGRDRGGRPGPVDIQPDAEMTSASCFTAIEAKRLRSSSFQPNQLAKLCVHAIVQAAGKTPLVLLVGVDPVVSVKGFGKLTAVDAVRLRATTVLNSLPQPLMSEADLLSRVPALVATITWPELHQVVSAAAAGPSSEDPSVDQSVKRLAKSIADSLARHQ